MLLYEFPPKLDRASRQSKALNDIAEHKKMQKNMYKNLVLAAVIIAISFFVSVIFVKVVLLIIGIGNAFVAYLLYQFSALSRDTQCYTRIYDDHIEHCQGSIINDKHDYYTLYYDDIASSIQTPRGKLIINLKEDFKSEIKFDKIRKHDKKMFDNNQIELNFIDTNAKLFLVNHMFEQIKYPKKEYNVIEDEDDEDDKWDSLHKHGL